MPAPPAGHFLRSQVVLKLPVPTKSFAGKTVIVTGSNTGMGLEAARHIARLGAARMVLAVRSLERGRAAAASIAKSTGCSDKVIQVWQLDLASYASVQAFAARVDTELERLDVVVENAGLLTEIYEWADDDEKTIKVNVLGTMFLALLLLPKLRKTAEDFSTDVVLTFTGSWMHWTTNFPEKDAKNIFDALANEKGARMGGNERYSTSKLLELLAFREMTEQLTQPKTGHIVTSIVNPGGVATDIVRDEQGLANRAMIKFVTTFLLRTAEQGGRTLVHAAEGGRDTDGRYLCDCRPAPPQLLSPFVKSENGAAAQRKVWSQMLARFEAVRPGIAANV